MSFSDSRNRTVPVQLPNQTLINIEVAQTGREDVAFDVKSFQGVTNAIEGVAEAITESLGKITPNKASVKFGLEIQIEQGSLVAAIVRGTGKANLEVTLEWEKSTLPKLEE
ncbi:CU044_2847 family protein [Acaryochloris marina NIES-2412]|uniref:CU044_2847 family protein n=1 Tax=Acaryochloris marina TaxID=155978 RepID=UPI00405A0C55